MAAKAARRVVAQRAAASAAVPARGRAPEPGRLSVVPTAMATVAVAVYLPGQPPCMDHRNWAPAGTGTGAGTGHLVSWLLLLCVTLSY